MQTKLINRILLTNDDGIDAPGLAILANIAKKLAHEVWIIAPIIDNSGVSNSMSLKSPFRVQQRDEKTYAVYGTPADCTLFALRYAMLDVWPDLILSGINQGSNVGFETLLSGTVGAAMTGTVLGVKSAALSQVSPESKGQINWSSAKGYAETILRQVIAIDWPADVCLNINFPLCDADNVKGVKMTEQGPADVRGFTITPTVDPEDNAYYWLRAKHSRDRHGEQDELGAINQDYIAITPLVYSRNHLATREALTKQVEGIIL